MNDLNLLQNVFYGNEINRVSSAKINLETCFSSLNHLNDFSDGGNFDFLKVKKICDDFYGAKISDSFGGRITYGDAYFIASLMSLFEPKAMVEFGVASGFSSGFICHAAHSLELVEPGKTYLDSFDIDNGSLLDKKVGKIVFENFPQFLPYWNLHLGKTSVDFSNSTEMKQRFSHAKSMAFIDAGHQHPWPAIDLLNCYKILSKDSWVLMQDVRMMERWLMDCIRFSVQCPSPVRGVGFAFDHWPGKKFSGVGSSFNMAAISLDVEIGDVVGYWKDMLKYNFEAKVDMGMVDKNIHDVIFDRN